MKKKTKRTGKNWPDYLKTRITQLRKKAKKANLDALLITNAHDIRYLTDFKGEDSWLLITPRKAVVLSDFRFVEELQRDCPFATHVLRKKSLNDELKKLVGDLGLKKIGIQTEYLTLQTHKAVIKAVGAKKLKPITGWLLEQRSIKDAHEVKLIRKAIGIQEQAFKNLMDEIKPGMTELQITAILEYHMKWLGADGPSFDTITGAGANSSLCHYTPAKAKSKKNGVVLIDFGALYQGYHSDMTRTIGLGGMPKKVREIYKIVHEAFLAAIDVIKPGVELLEVDSQARNLIKKAGYAKQFGHGLGHGIGLDVHEMPNIGARSTGVLKEGQIVTVEPGIYLPGIGGVRIEDDILVTKKGHKNLCRLPTDLKSAII